MTKESFDKACELNGLIHSITRLIHAIDTQDQFDFGDLPDDIRNDAMRHFTDKKNNTQKEFEQL